MYACICMCVCVCHMYSHRNVNVPTYMSSQNYAYQFITAWSFGLTRFVKNTLSLMKHDPKMLFYVIANVLTTQSTHSQPLVNEGCEGYHLSATFYFSWTILALCASEVRRLLVPEMFTEFGWSAFPGYLSHFLFLYWMSFLLYTKNSLSSVCALYCDKKEIMNGFF